MPHEAQTVRITLPEMSAALDLPAGWTLDETAPAPTLVGPEGDLRVAYVVLPNDRPPEAIAAAAWRMVEPGFDATVRSQAEGTPAEGWDVAYQIVYATPAADSRTVMAALRILGGRAFVNLLSGTSAALAGAWPHRRGRGRLATRRPRLRRPERPRARAVVGCANPGRERVRSGSDARP